MDIKCAYSERPIPVVQKWVPILRRSSPGRYSCLQTSRLLSLNSICWDPDRKMDRHYLLQRRSHRTMYNYTRGILSLNLHQGTILPGKFKLKYVLKEQTKKVECHTKSI